MKCLTLCGLAALVAVGLAASVPAPASHRQRAEPARAAPAVTRFCITEHAAYYDSSEADFRKRFACYKALGVDTLRVQTGWLDRPAMVSALKGTRFRIKMILYVLGIPPDYAARYPSERMVDEHGVADWHLGPWSAARLETTSRAGRAEMRKLVASGLADRVDEVVVDLGPAGEGIYPANWTVNDRPGEEAFWYCSAQAQDSFRATMKARYGDISAANDAWRLAGPQRFESWERVAIPRPRTEWARGPFWNDMLTWYRDSKRKMILEQIDQTQRLAREYLGKRVRCIVYLPGWAYTQADWDQAVREASGPASIRLMMDNDWLMRAAVASGCVLQYTGAENVDEVRNIVRKLKAAGSRAYTTMWGENAGVEASGRNPIWLAEVITRSGIRGVDYTWSNWLFEKDGVTPSRTYPRFAHAVRMIRSFYATGRRLAPYLPDDVARQTAPGRWTLSCVAATRLMGSYPDVVKGGDPEIAVVEGGQTQRILLRFPLELLPRGCQIRRARLVMSRYHDYGDDKVPLALGVYRIAQPWASISANWQQAMDGVPWKRPGGDAVDTRGQAYARGADRIPWASVDVAPFANVGDRVEWDVTSLCRKLTTGPNHGMMIAAAGPGSADKSFASLSHPDAEMRPVLYVEVAAPATPRRP